MLLAQDGLSEPVALEVSEKERFHVEFMARPIGARFWSKTQLSAAEKDMPLEKQLLNCCWVMIEIQSLHGMSGDHATRITHCEL